VRIRALLALTTLALLVAPFVGGHFDGRF